MLVEDNKMNQRLAQKILGRAGMIVDIVGDGESAVAAVKRADYDAVLMDIQMPGMDGYEATQIIREDIRYRSLPIIAMTANTMNSERERCLSIGMNAYLAKPVDPSELYETLAAWVSTSGETVEQTDKSGERDADDSPSDLPETIPGINIQSGLRRCGGSGKLFLELLRSFRETRYDTLSRVKRSLEDHDLATAGHLVHSLKGVSGNLAAEELFETAKKLESAIVNRDEQTLPQRLNECELALRKLLHSLDALGKDDGSDGGLSPSLAATRPDDSQIRRGIRRLDGLIKANDFTALECTRALKMQLYDTTHREELSRLEKHLVGFDFKSARHTLSQLAQDMNASLQEKP